MFKEYIHQVLITLMGLLALCACDSRTETKPGPNISPKPVMQANEATRPERPAPPPTLFIAEQIITMAEDNPLAEAVIVFEDTILAVGTAEDLAKMYPTAQIDTRFADKILLPGLIDPHIHMGLSSLQYATELTPPWEMATPDGIVPGLPDRAAFLARVSELATANQTGRTSPLILFGYHNLIHGALSRDDLDAITAEFPLIIWHYSSHDFYMNSKALDWAEITPDLHDQYEGISLDAAGELTGRVYEDALPYLLAKLHPILFAPERMAKGLEGFSSLLRAGGVTTVADLGYGLFGREGEDAHIRSNWISPEHSGYRLYLVPEHRAFRGEFGEDAPDIIAKMVAGDYPSSAPLLAQVKFFTDAAFYSQTMRISPPGYLAGQSKGTEGLWVIEPDDLLPVIEPYWTAGFDVRIHSNGDAAQAASLNALEMLRETSSDQRFIFEHGGLFSPEQRQRAGALGAGVSAASHYVYYLGEAYQAPLGEMRGSWISPLGSLSKAGVPVTLHSDAPLAPPLPLRAASVHMTRATREGGVLTPDEALSAQEALEAITSDAAYALGLEDRIGRISPGLYADFTVLESNPLDTEAEDWADIKIWGVVMGGELRALDQ